MSIVPHWFLKVYEKHSQLFAFDQDKAWSGVQRRGYIDVWEHYGDDRYPSNEDLYSLELDFLDTCVASMSLCLLAMILGCIPLVGAVV